MRTNFIKTRLKFVKKNKLKHCEAGSLKKKIEMTYFFKKITYKRTT